MNSNFDTLEEYLFKKNIISTKELLEDKSFNEKIKYINKEIENKDSKLNAFINNIIIEKNILELDKLGTLLNKLNLAFNFKMQSLDTEDVELIKLYIKHADENTCTNKVNFIKLIIKSNDLEGVDILLNNKFITNRNVDKYLNFAINSRKYEIVPKLMDKKNS
ncbi:MAG: hypothetical protein ACRCYC_10250 [Paraclostridium sp.]|uniref:hypothetical protein n=1 Tax=Paraclostridium sp. TaxID=2023273 RepID=UPI003F31E249